MGNLLLQIYSVLVFTQLKQYYCDLFAQFGTNLQNKFVLCSTLYTQMLKLFLEGKKFIGIPCFPCNAL